MLIRILVTICVGVVLLCLFGWIISLGLWVVMNSPDIVLVMLFGGGIIIPIVVISYYISDYLISWKRRKR